MAWFKTIVNCVLGPRIFRIHNGGNSISAGQPYFATPLEGRIEKAFDVISAAKSILYYTSPVWMVMLYRRSYFTISFGQGLLKYSAWFAVIYFGLLCVRGFARSGNQAYLNFISVLERSKRPYADPTEKRKYDFAFSHWPVDFRWDQVEERKFDTPPYHFTGRLQKLMENSTMAKLLVQGLPCEIVSYALSHGFGLSLVYPGSTGVLNTVIGPALLDGRNKLVEVSAGKRAKLLARDGNSIDTMFVDRRSLGEDTAEDESSQRANTLVICFEGNAGFYEVGVMVTPMQLGYSALGWNHPGFGGSTGSPSPAAEINAVDVVMQYAIHKLGFKPENIILFAWSIGAFSAIHGARMYPDVKSVFIDASFDDILPLAKKAMPVSLEGVVKRAIRGYINLNNGEILKEYSGPVHFVRRQMDEVMNIDGQRLVSSNCGNDLLHKFLSHRFPSLFCDNDEERIEIKAALDSWLGKDDDALRESVLASFEVQSDVCEKMLQSYFSCNSNKYPIKIGESLTLLQKQQLVLYLATKHMSHFDNTHCPPLSSTMFVDPWDVEKDLRGVPTSDSDQCSSDDFEMINGNNKL